MRILELQSVLIYQITMDDGHEYQRSANSDNWMKLYGMSWETCSPVEEFQCELAFDKYRNEI
jgi:hypothetical protein